MERTILKLALVSSIALTLCGIAIGVAADLKPRDAPSEQIGDAHRAMQILTAFNRNPRLHVFDFSVAVDADTVVIGGTVDDDNNKNLAEKIAIDVGGIKFVDNHIVVDAAYMRAHPTTSD